MIVFVIRGSFQRRTERHHAAVKRGFHRRNRYVNQLCNLLKLHLFMDAKRQDFPEDGRHLCSAACNSARFFARGGLLEAATACASGTSNGALSSLSCISSRLAGTALRRWSIATLCAMVSSQVHEAASAVVVVALLQHAHPGFLEQVLGGSAVPGQMQQVAQQAMLILRDQCVEQVRIATAQAHELCGPLRSPSKAAN